MNFTGYASTTGVFYDMGWYDEKVAPGAFGKTLAESPDVQLVINHGGLPIARTGQNMTLDEDSVGLLVDADLDDDDPDVQTVARKLNAGLVDQMSFCFRVTRQTWNTDYTQRTIQECDLHRGDVSIVNQGANGTTSASVRTMVARAAGRVSIPERKKLADELGGLAVVEMRSFSFGGRRFDFRSDGGDVCNRCGGGGTISLKGKGMTCPQCKGTGTGEGNADLTDGDGSTQDDRGLDVPDYTYDARIRLEALRYPPEGGWGARDSGVGPSSHSRS